MYICIYVYKCIYIYMYSCECVYKQLLIVILNELGE